MPSVACCQTDTKVDYTTPMLGIKVLPSPILLVSPSSTHSKYLHSDTTLTGCSTTAKFSILASINCVKCQKYLFPSDRLTLRIAVCSSRMISTNNKLMLSFELSLLATTLMVLLVRTHSCHQCSHNIIRFGV